MSSRGLWWALSFATLAACKSHGPAPNMDAVTAKSVSGPDAPRQEHAHRGSAWRQALRLLDYPKAAASFDAVHPEPRAPELRYVRAKLAFELEQHGRLLVLCPGLPEAVPQYGDRIRRWCALAALQAGDAPDVAERLSSSSRLDDAMAAIDELIELKRWEMARKASDALLTRVKDASVPRQARVRRQRARLLELTDDPTAAAEEYRWLASSAASDPNAEGADEALERLTGKRLTKQQRYDRAEAFTKAANLEAVQRELSLLRTAPGAGVPKVQELRTLAWAYYRSRKDYGKASELFSQCAKLDKTYRTQDTFYAARALSRAHRDDEAIVAYRALAKRWPNSSFAEEASFLVGRLHFVLGQWDHAVKAHADYRTRYPRGRFLDSARYEQALAMLAKGEGATARRELSQLAEASNSSRERAALRELEAVAYVQEGKVAEAAGVFASVIEERPLSFAAMMSAARLSKLEQTPPAAIPHGDPENPEQSSPPPPPLQVELPQGVAWLTNIGLDLEAEAELYRLEAEVERKYAPRGGEALCLAYGQLSVAKQRYRHAQRTVRERALQRAMTPATQWLWECIYPMPYADAVERAERRHGVHPGLVHAVMRQESAFSPRVKSPANAVGLMQLIPPTARSAASELGMQVAELDLRIPGQNIELGTFYLGKLLKTFEGSAPLAAAGYNAGPGAVGRWLSAAGDLPLDLFVAYIPYTETRNYVRRVMGNWARYSYLAGGVDALPSLSLELPGSVTVSASDY